MGMRPLKKQVDVLKKILSLKLVCLAIIVVGLVFYFKPSDTNKKPIEKRPSSTEVIHEGNLKDVQLFGEKNIYYKLDEQKYYSKYAIPEGSAVKEKIIDYTNLMELIDKNTGFDLQAGFKFQKQAKNVKTDINLFAIYPEFKEKMLSGEYEIYPRLQLLSSKEWFDTLLHWFAPKGQDTLPGVKIEARYSIDGQEHEIRSYDEFKQYYNGKGGELSE